MKNYFIDSNIFLRLFDDSSEKHQECKRLFSQMESGRFKGTICSVVLLEIYFTLRRYYQLPKKSCQEKIARILEAKNLFFNDDFDYRKVSKFFEKTGIKLPDCLIASLRFFKKGGAIVSYDREFDRLGVKRLEPSQV